MGRAARDPGERFWEKTQPIRGCRIWTASTDRGGYGRFQVGKRAMQAHQWAYESANGPVPDGLELDHLCRVRLCVNPDHLEAVTHAENMRRGLNATRTHCRRGHPYSGENLYVDPSGNRYCRRCVRASGRRYRERQYEESTG